MNHINLFNQIEPSGRKSYFLAMQQLLHRVVAIFAMVVMCGGAWAQTRDGYYKFRNRGNTNYYLTVSNNNYNNNAATPYLMSSNANGKTGDEAIWAVYSYNGSKILVHATDGRIVVTHNANAGEKRVHLENIAVTNDNNSILFTQTITTNNGNTYYWFKPNRSGNNTYLNPYGGNGNDIGLYKDNSDTGNQWTRTTVNNAPTIAAPTISSSDMGHTVSLACTNTYARIYYTTNGTNPTTSSTRYTGSFNITETKTIKAIAYVGFIKADGTFEVVSQSNVTTQQVEVITPTTLAFISNALTMTQTTLSLPSVSLKAGGNTISGTVTYSSNNTGCVSVSNTGVLTVNGAGTATITASYAGNDTYAPSSATMTITVANTAALDETILSDMTITPSSQTLDLGQQVTYSASESLSRKHRTRQAYTTITANGNNYYKVGANYQAAAPITNEDSTPVPFTSFNWSVADGTAYFGLIPYQSTTSNQVTLTRSELKTASNKTFTISVTGVYGGQNKTATATVTIPATLVDLTALHAGEALNLSVGESGTVEGHYTWEPDYDEAGAAYKKFTYTSGDTDIATVDADGKVTGVAPGATTITIQSEKLDGTSGVSCTITVNVSVAAPTISIDPNGYVTITSPVAGLSIRYTTDDSNPTATTGNEYSTTFGPVSNETVIKAVAVSNGTASSVASKQYITSGISGGTVILNDYEDHNWSYYKGLDYTITNPDGTTISYKDKYRYSIYSPDPRNVKITYRGYDIENGEIDLGGTTKVNISTLNSNTAPHVSNVEVEGQNTFVYYKTLEKFVIGFFEQHKTGDDYDGTPANPNNTAEQYPYTVISNPFSVRPSTGSGTGKKYYGFAGWKIISGGEYILEYNDDDIIPLDAIIHFTGMESGYTPNCTSADVVLEATWTQATVNTGNANTSFDGGTYETNFLIITNNTVNAFTQNSPCTITAMYPDGTNDNSNSRTLNGLTVGANHVKVEWIRHGNGTFNANGNNLTLGRGITSSNGSNQGTVYGMNSNMSFKNIVKVESGCFSTFKSYHANGTAGQDFYCYSILGCDYDRARTDYYSGTSNVYNSKLKINTLHSSNDGQPNRSHGELYVNTVIKSGEFLTDNTSQLYYHRATSEGQRCLVIEGGWLKGMITGGSESGQNPQYNARALTMRVKGNARIDSRISGGSTRNDCSGDRCMIFTGGRIVGWIAAGSNSSDNTGNGVTNGESYVYVGGNTKVDSRQFGGDGTDLFGTHSTGGVVYGSGCGWNRNYPSGQMTQGSNVVLSDQAFVERGIYGGGAVGMIPSGSLASIYILGGHVGTGTGAIVDEYNNTGKNPTQVSAGVFGGACNNGGGYSNIFMNGGVVESGIYGGSNLNGTMANDVRIQIDGGQVGTDATHTANVHGGGYGQPTIVSGNVDIKLGADGAERDSEGVVVYGDVYGGSALGSVNGTNATDTYHTNVTLNAGTIHGSLYGGALGSQTVAANVYGPVAITVNGGSVFDGAVFGCNNINGSPQRDVTVTINGTNMPESGYALNGVYGGGNLSDYVPVNGVTGYPKVYVNGCENSIKDLYGGGNAASVPNTNVEVQGGLIDRLFAGGNGESGKAAHVGYRSGTNNNPGTQYGTGNTYAKIMGGEIHQIFGGSNSMGTIRGTITLDVDKDDYCEVFRLGEIYGGGNEAPSQSGTINIGCTGTYTPASEGVEENGYIRTVFGGANAANITGDIALNIRGGKIGTVYGGNNASGTISGSVTVNIDKKITGTTLNNCGVFDIGTVYGGGKKADMAQTANVVTVNINDNGTNDNKTIGNVYGGGEEASVYSTTVNLRGGTITGNVFGGGKGTADAPNKVMIINGGTHVNAYGGSVANIFGGNDAGGTITGNLNVKIDKTHTEDATGYTYKTLTITEDVYGGGNQASSAAGTINVVCANAIRNIFGGAKNADVSGDINLSVGSGQIQNIYGGNNLGGKAGGNITVSVTKVEGDCGNNFTVGNIFGGGYGADTNTGGNVTVNIGKSTGGAAGDVTISGDVYGGSALGAVNAVNTNTTTVNLYGGTLSGNVYGGGLGQLASAATATEPAKEKISAVVNGSTAVNVYAGTTFVPAKDSENKYTYTTGMVFGCNNMAGAPAGTATVTVNGTSTLLSVYGGGNLADYTGNPTVHVLNGTLAGNVFGGGLGKSAIITGSPIVNIGDWDDNHEVSIGGDVFGGGDLAAVEGDCKVTIRDCNTAILGDLYGGGNAAPVYSTNTTMWGGTVAGNVFGGGNGADETKNPNGAQIGYKSNDETKAGSGNAVTNIYGGTIGTWEEVNGVETCTDGGGIFGGSNTNGNIAGKVVLTIDQRACTEDNADDCTPLKIKELYGSGNEAAYAGTGIEFNLGCVAGLNEIYGGAKNADMSGDIHLIISSGHFKRVFGGNNMGGCINGNIKVSIDETGCNPVIIDELFCGGNQAAYSVYGYNTDKTPKTSGEVLYDNPQVEVISCTHIGQVFGGGLGASAKVVGTTNVLIDEIPGDHCNTPAAAPYVNADKLGSIGDVFGGGNAADVVGDTNVKIGTKGNNAHIGKEGVTTINTEPKPAGVNITGNVYGGGSAADVTGKTYVTVGRK